MIDVAEVISLHCQIADALKLQIGLIETVAETMIATLRRGGKILCVGNGGSAADAQHFAAELVGRFRHERPAYAALALTTDTSILTAVANDFGFEQVFARQLAGLCRPEDLLVALSTSGNSANILAAVTIARQIGAQTVGMTGAGGGKLLPMVQHCLTVPAESVARIQEMHGLLIHILCELIEKEMMARHDES